jgi:lipopolysaccharide transport protein LptA
MNFTHFLFHALRASSMVLSLGLAVQVAFADFDDVGLDAVSPAPTPQSQAPKPKVQPTTGRKPSASEFPAAQKPQEKSKQNVSERKETSNSTESPQPRSSKRNSRERGDDHNEAATVVYSADTLEGSLVLGQVRLEGDVKIEQANAIMKADKAEILSDKKTSTPKKAIAKGRVSLFKSATAESEELRALAREMEYFIPTRKVILKGDPKIWRGPELLEGKVIEVFLDTNEIKVKGARGVMSSPSGTSAADTDQKKSKTKPVSSGKKNQ